MLYFWSVYFRRILKPNDKNSDEKKDEPYQGILMSIPCKSKISIITFRRSLYNPVHTFKKHAVKFYTLKSYLKDIIGKEI